MFDKLNHKAKKAIEEYKHRLEYSLIDYHLLPSHQDYQKFVIVCGIRSGSTMLCSLLSSHPQTITFFEIFHRYFGSTPFNTPGYRAKCKDEKIVNLRNTEPVKFIESHIYKPFPNRVKAVGFKLLYTQARNQDPWWNSSDFDRWWQDVGRPPTLTNAKSDLWSYLKENKDIAIIHLRRDNLLERLVSGNTAIATGKWGIGATGGLDNKNQVFKLQLNFEECLQDFEAIRRMEDEAEEVFAHHKKLVITYEELVEKTAGITNQVQSFLGLTTQNLVTETKKQATQPLWDVIDNYYQLKSQFTNTPWSIFFEKQLTT